MEEEEEGSSVQSQQLGHLNEENKLQEKDEHSSSNTQLPQIHDSKKKIEISNEEENLQEENEQPSFDSQAPEIDDLKELVEGSNFVSADETDVVDDGVAQSPSSIVNESAPSIVVENATVFTEAPSIVVEEPPSIVAEDTPVDVPPLEDGQDSLSVVVKDTPSLPSVAKDTPSMAVEDAPIDMPTAKNAPSMVAEDAVPSANAEEAHSVVAEDTPMDVPPQAEDAPSTGLEVTDIVAPPIDAEDDPVTVAHSIVAEDTPIDAPPNAENAPSVVAKETLSMVAEDAHIDALPFDAEVSLSSVADDTPSIIAEEASMAAKDVPLVAEEALIKVAENASPMVAGDGTPGVEEDASPMVAEDASSMVVEDTTPRVEEDASPMVAEDASPMVAEDATPGVAEDASPTVAEDASPVVNEVASPGDDENASPMDADEVAHVSEVDTEMEMETEVVETGVDSGRKRKRGRPAKAQAKAPPLKRTEEEDVCFICFDGGNLVLCDRRGCPKAYHPACVNRDEAFFRSKGRWNCGWHICSNCEKAAHYMCYTCTYSLCKGCIKEAEFFCVRGNRGFCETCMRTVMLIEKNEQAQVDFNDKSSWEYLFKEYWIDLKEKLSLTPDELTLAKNPSKGSNALARKGESSEELYDANDDKGSDSDGSSGHLEVSSSSKRRKAKRRLKSSKEEEPPKVIHVVSEGTPLSNDAEWASKELLEFVAHMKNGDTSVLSQFDVQHLLLDYIKLNHLRDPRRKSQIVCDSRLENLFGKARVGHFEMLKLLELHFLIKEDTHADDIEGATADTEANQLDGDGSAGTLTKTSLDKRRKSRKKGDGKGPQTNLDDYAAIDVYNIKLLYLRRNLMEDLLEDSDKFHDKVVGSFVRIRISGAGQKHDMYRLVQVVGTRKAAEPYKTGKRSADVVLEILNLNKAEVISIDTISNQEFSEDECKRLRQSIKCGLLSRMTVGEVQEKAMTLQAVRVNDWLEMEKLRISHLRDRASEQGRRKDLRECVEKLQLLNTPEERLRRLEEIPEVHADPKMDPNYESEEAEEQDNRPQDKVTTPRDTGFSRKGREPISPGKGSPVSVDTWSGARKSSNTGSEPGRNMSTIGVWDRGYGANGSGETVSGDTHQLNSWEKPKNLVSPMGALSGQAVGRPGPSPGSSQELATPLPNISETDKMWHYKDPSGKTQGPFAMVQLRKWSTSGHFPADLRIWRTTENQEDSILLSDALVGKYTKEVPPPEKTVVLPENNREVNWGSGWEGGTTNTAWTDNTPNSNWKDASGFANGGTQMANTDVWGSGSSNWVAPTTDFRGGQSGHSSRGGWGPRGGNNAWAGRPVHNPYPSPAYSGQQHRPTAHQGNQSGGRWNHGQNRGNWNSNRYRGPHPNSGRGGYDNRANNMGYSGQLPVESWRAPPENNTKGWSSWNTVEPPKPVTGGWNLEQSNRNISSNLPSPTPNTSNENWSPTPGSGYAANAPRMASNGMQLSPVVMVAGLQHFVPTSPQWAPSPGPASLPKPMEEGRGDFSSPPTPTPASAGTHHQFP